MNKNDFLEKLKDITPQQINQIIRENGKPRKLVKAVEFDSK